MHDHYKIDGTKNICKRELDGKEYNNPEYWPTYQEDYHTLKQNIMNSYKNKIPTTFVRIFDGEFWFLDGKKIGNVGKRHCSKSLGIIDIKKFKEGFLANDYVFTQIYSDFLPKYHRLFPSRPDIKPMEHIYSIVANKWIFKTFSNDGIGLIGGEHKMSLIKKLMEHDEYRDYLGVQEFTDYISVPEKFTCDNVEKLEQDIGKQLETSKSKIFLFGIGISKLAVAHAFKKYKNAIFIDIGAGISALAGTTSIERPYFGGWINYRLKNHDYSKMDQIDYKDTRGKNEIWLD